MMPTFLACFFLDIRIELIHINFYINCKQSCAEMVHLLSWPAEEEKKRMDTMLVIALMVVSCTLINPFVSATELKKIAAVEQTDTQQGESGEEDETEDEEEEQPSN